MTFSIRGPNHTRIDINRISVEFPLQRSEPQVASVSGSWSTRGLQFKFEAASVVNSEFWSVHAARALQSPPMAAGRLSAQMFGPQVPQKMHRQMQRQVQRKFFS
jgi:hypothetical protein